MKQTPTAFRWILFLALIIASSIACKDKPDYQDEFQERIILQLLLEPTPNPVGRCESYYSSMGECLSQSSDPKGAVDSLGLAQVFYALTESRPATGGNLQEVCSEIIAGRFFSRFTNRAKDCYLSCQRRAWENLQRNNQCENSYSSLFNTELETGRSISCFRECGQVNNTTEF